MNIYRNFLECFICLISSREHLGSGYWHFVFFLSVNCLLVFGIVVCGYTWRGEYLLFTLHLRLLSSWQSLSLLSFFQALSSELSLILVILRYHRSHNCAHGWFVSNLVLSLHLCPFIPSLKIQPHGSHRFW